MKVDFLNMEREAQQLISDGLMGDLEKVILSGRYLFGPKSEELEYKLSERFNSNVVLVGSGTDALYLSLKALNIGAGDIVAIPSISAIPTAVAVKMTGATIKYIEIDPFTITMDIKKILYDNSNISAIILVHLYGNVADLKHLKKHYKNTGIPFIEDCAQAFGSKFKNKYVGNIGTLGAFSLYPSKNLGTFGDAGFITTYNLNMVEYIKELRFYGQKNRYSIGSITGMNSRVDELQSTILLKKLKNIDQVEDRRKEIFYIYENRLKDIAKIDWREGCMPHVYPIYVDKRKKFIESMKNVGIETSIHYPFVLPQAIDKLKQIYPESESVANSIVSIPFNPWMTKEEIEYVLENTLKFAEL